jgi:hypothetical protein
MLTLLWSGTPRPSGAQQLNAEHEFRQHEQHDGRYDDVEHGSDEKDRLLGKVQLLGKVVEQDVDDDQLSLQMHDFHFHE